MTSGEWDLRALKALEEEEQKEFLALSQKSLFEPPSPPPGAAVNASGINSDTPSSTSSLAGKSSSTLTYAQLHPHLLKLPTIDECQLIAAAKRNSLHSNGGSATSGGRLKFTRALSLSAHSLTARGGGVGSSSGGGGGGFGKKLKAKLIGGSAKSSGSLSPTHYSYSVSPVYTPPPIRRCATLHHTQPVRKTFKTLQQLERQKQEHKLRQQTTGGNQRTSPQLQRVAGTNKTFWKYGANSTAASIIGQRAQAKLKSKSPKKSTERGVCKTDDLNAATLPVKADVETYYDDSATETGSCSVPLPLTDSNEMLRLMLTAASTAVSTGNAGAGGSSVGCLAQPPDIATATAPTAISTATGAAGQTGLPQQTAFMTLATHRYQQLPQMNLDPNETVAYEAFHALTNSRRKSFSAVGRSTLLRGSSVTAQESGTLCAEHNSGIGGSANNSAVNNSNIRKMLKSTSMDAANAASVSAVNGEQIDFVGLTVMSETAAATTTATATTTIPTTVTTKTIKTNHMCNLPKTSTAAVAVLKALGSGSTGSGSGSGNGSGNCIGAGGGIGLGTALHFNGALMHTNEPHQQLQHQQHAQHSHLQDALELNGVVCYGLDHGSHSSPPNGNGAIIDDELEQHIKHCSCSCNHMGYGNSMDYQVRGVCSSYTDSHTHIQTYK